MAPGQHHTSIACRCPERHTREKPLVPAESMGGVLRVSPQTEPAALYIAARRPKGDKTQERDQLIDQRPLGRS